MNIRTPTDIDRAITAACDLHDDQAGQVGSRRPAPQRPSAGLLDTQPGDAGLDVAADEDRYTYEALKTDRAEARKVFQSCEFLDLEDNIREARCTAELAMLAMLDYVTKQDASRLAVLEFAVERARYAAAGVYEEYHRD